RGTRRGTCRQPDLGDGRCRRAGASRARADAGRQAARMNAAPRKNVVVVGSGIAGLTAALHAADAGQRTTLVTKDAIGGGSTPLAQGGVAGVYGPGDYPALHASDTLTAGAGLSDAAAV